MDSRAGFRSYRKKCTKCYKGCNCVGTEDKNEEGCLLLLGSEVNPHYVAHISGFVFAVQLVRSKNMLIAFLCWGVTPPQKKRHLFTISGSKFWTLVQTKPMFTFWTFVETKPVYLLDWRGNQTYVYFLVSRVNQTYFYLLDCCESQSYVYFLDSRVNQTCVC